MATYNGTTVSKIGCRLVQNAATTHYHDFMACWATASSDQRGLFEMDCSDLDPSAVISSAYLHLHYTGWLGTDTVGRTIKVYRCRRPGASGWSASTCTWNIYSTGNNWATAGCGSSESDYDASLYTSFVIPAAAGFVDTIDITALLQDAIDNRSGLLSLYLIDEGANSAGNSLFDGDDMHIVATYTLPLPTVDTVDPPTNIAASSVTLEGSITDDGGVADYYGFVLDTVAISDPGNVDPDTWTPGGSGHGEDGHKVASADHGNNPFDHGVTGLSSLTTYYYRACAHNQTGWAYGDQVSFATLATHRVSNADTPGVKAGGVYAVGAKVLVFDLLAETVAIETVDADGMWSHDAYGSADVIPKLVCAIAHDVKASLSTSEGSNKDLVFTAKATDATHWYPGAAGNSLTITYANTGSLSVSVSGADITVNINAGVTTAAQIKAAIEADGNANKMVSVAYKAGQDGSGTPAAMAKTNLADGAYYVNIAPTFITPGLIT